MPVYTEEEGAQTGTQVGQLRYRWALSKNNMADITIVGSNIGKKDFEMLKKYLDLTKEAFEGEDQE